MVGGHFLFGPTYNSTQFVRALVEGSLFGFSPVNVTAANAINGELAGKIVSFDANGEVVPCKADGVGAVGLCREDIKDMINASDNASFYFRGGAYYVAETRLGDDIANFTVGGYATTDANGALVPTTDKEKAVATVIGAGTFPMGNMYHWAGDAANGGKFLGISLLV